MYTWRTLAKDVVYVLGFGSFVGGICGGIVGWLTYSERDD